MPPSTPASTSSTPPTSTRRAAARARSAPPWRRSPTRSSWRPRVAIARTTRRSSSRDRAELRAAPNRHDRPLVPAPLPSGRSVRGDPGGRLRVRDGGPDQAGGRLGGERRGDRGGAVHRPRCGGPERVQPRRAQARRGHRLRSGEDRVRAVLPARRRSDTGRPQGRGRHEASANQIKLAWLLHRSPCVVPIPGRCRSSTCAKTSPRSRSSSSEEAGRMAADQRLSGAALRRGGRGDPRCGHLPAARRSTPSRDRREPSVGRGYRDRGEDGRQRDLDLELRQPGADAAMGATADGSQE